jgi:hypothetical protein
MVSQPDPERLYTDEEVAAILRRAVQPRSRASANLPTRTREGINLATLEQIATETGIDPARVREAALSLEADSESEGGSILFGPRSSHVFDRVIEGEVPRERLSDLVAAMRRLTRVKGKVVEVGDWLEWTSDASSIHVTVKPENGQTRLQLMGDAGFRLLGIWGPLTLATFIAIVATGDAGVLTVGLAGIIVGWGYAIARVAWEIAGRRGPTSTVASSINSPSRWRGWRCLRTPRVSKPHPASGWRSVRNRTD